MVPRMQGQRQVVAWLRRRDLILTDVRGQTQAEFYPVVLLSQDRVQRGNKRMMHSSYQNNARLLEIILQFNP
jgi:hypothetical protein